MAKSRPTSKRLSAKGTQIHNDGFNIGTETGQFTLQIKVMYWLRLGKQIGKIRVPLSMNPDKSLASEADKARIQTLEAAIPQLADLLSSFYMRTESDEPLCNAVLASWHEWLTATSAGNKHQAPIYWLHSLPIARNPHIDEVLVSPLEKLLRHSQLLHVPFADRLSLVSGPGAAFLHLFSIQHDLSEDTNLDGGLLAEPEAKAVLPTQSNITEALRLMWDIIDPFEIKSEKGWSFDELWQFKEQFTSDHVVYDQHGRTRLLSCAYWTSGASSATKAKSQTEGGGNCDGDSEETSFAAEQAVA
jgi:hypothetical protein